MSKMSALLFFSLVSVVLCDYRNIHIKLDAETEAFVVQANDVFHRICPSDDIDLRNKEQPHITLYLTDFVNGTDAELISAIESAINQFESFDVGLNNTVAVGQYGMWQTTIPRPLQDLSDLIVNATFHLVNPNQAVPEWIKNLPADEREKKLAMFKKYGSPNVFSSFQPHVTLCWDQSHNNVVRMLSSVPLGHPTSRIATVAIAHVGPHGTALRGEDIASFSLSQFP
ncbi:signal peptide protein [Carpediemonas membranifera]|uniref:Signal peptide protein n=1 Tax=Carpediemonas membranifera TaxID=201153 RepID=A0A8J6EAS7_9EUKA|nr:signal peptide protein [Carpediemonas membranifera]|eukprot:KAG9395260.1 signal peptide protein [Carpediemonas membranifera]